MKSQAAFAVSGISAAVGIALLALALSIEPYAPLPENGPASGLYAVGTVERVIDGDTLAARDGTRYRLALVDTPETGEQGHSEASAFTSSACPAGGPLAADLDDGQPRGSYGRAIAKVWCGDDAYGYAASGLEPPMPSVNEALVERGHACIDSRFTAQSEFGREAWAASGPAC